MRSTGRLSPVKKSLCNKAEIKVMFYRSGIVFFAVMMLPNVLPGQAKTFYILNNVKARPLAMGGAFMAIQDDIAAAQYNPAAFSLYKLSKRKRFTVFLNPVSPVLGGIESDEIFSGDGTPLDDGLLALSLLVKAVTLDMNSLEFGMILGEESLNLPAALQSEDLIRTEGYRQNHMHSFVGKVSFADKVFLGGGATVYSESKPSDLQARKSAWGISYGILLKPERGLNIGVSFFNLPDSLNQEIRLPLERIVDESVNIGVSYNLGGTTVSMDVRNLGEEQNVAVREFHFGIEQVLMSQIALRAGFYTREGGTEVFSAGLGLFDGNALVRFENRFAHRNFWLNYAFVYEKADFTQSYSHFFSLIFRI